MPTIDVICGDALTELRKLPTESLQTCVTSPPYYALRDYGVPGQIGMEPTLDEYLCRLLEVFREVWRVLRPDGTLWCNLGDAYATHARGHNGFGTSTLDETAQRVQALTGFHRRGDDRYSAPALGLKDKDLMGLPWLVAFALRSDGWYLRSDIIWAKPNPMPESVGDRPTRAHEYIFLLSKSRRYYYDAAAIREPLKLGSMNRWKVPDGWDTNPGAHGTIHRNGRSKGARADKQRGHGRRHDGFNDRWDGMTKEEQQANGANKRTVWTVATQPYPEAHFATFPERLIEPCILAGCPVGGTVLDPFAGSGTTLAVALRLGRSAIGIELNPAYVDLIHKRLSVVTPPLPLEEAVS